VTKEGDSSTSDLDPDIDDSEHCDLESNQLNQIDCEDEFGDTGTEELVKSEGTAGNSATDTPGAG
jgi:hypothetical protein